MNTPTAFDIKAVSPPYAGFSCDSFGYDRFGIYWAAFDQSLSLPVKSLSSYGSDETIRRVRKARIEETLKLRRYWRIVRDTVDTACRSAVFLKHFKENDLIHELASWLMIFGDRIGLQIYKEAITNSGVLEGCADADYVISDVWFEHRESPGDWKELVRLVHELEGAPAPDLDPPPPPAGSWRFLLEQLREQTSASEPPPFKIGEVPEASHLTTDQANAARLAAFYGGKELISAGGDFYVWKDIRWERDVQQGAYYGAQLSSIVGKERQGWRAKFESMAALNPDGKKLESTQRRDMSKLEDNLRATADGLAMVIALYKAEALEKWQKQCEMRTNINNALSLLRGLLTIDVALFDQNPALLNCQNGTIDLRNGRLRQHNPKDLITQCAPVNYDPNAKAPLFEKFLREILPDPEQVKFLQRWLGYCATGETGEQKMLLHIGEGANGKSTLQEAIEDVLGSYAHTAPRGLLTDAKGDDRHPTEIAGLFRKRLVTSAESEDNAALRESFIKLATGGDRLSGRWMGKDFFEFLPTHKLQLLTNHKPNIKGSDFGIWRRIFLLHYLVKFGTDEEIAAGRATKLRDRSLKKALLAEREGIFAWIVRGAIDWYRDGLRPPRSVLEANESYRMEQDRVGQFVRECCIIEADTWSPFSGAMTGLYPAYRSWCGESGYQALGMKRFVDELARVVPRFRKAEKKLTVGDVRKTVNGAYGLRVNLSGWAAEVPQSGPPSANGDLV